MRFRMHLHRSRIEKALSKAAEFKGKRDYVSQNYKAKAYNEKKKLDELKLTYKEEVRFLQHICTYMYNVRRS